MIDKLTFLQTYSSYGSIGEVLRVWEDAGFFAYLLPFLLIFALVFVMLSRIEAFKENTAVSGIIALAVGLMSLQFDFVPVFFSEIFPRVGVGLAIILCLLILVGVFTDPKKGYFAWIFVGVGAVIFAVVLIQTAGSVGWSSGYWWRENWPVVAGGIFILVLIAVIVGGGTKKEKSDPLNSLFFTKN